jgi:hypothetical protein
LQVPKLVYLRCVLSRQIQPYLFYTFFCLFFDGLECVARSFASIAHYEFLRNVRIRTQKSAVASGRATNLATHLSKNLATYLPN